MGRYRKYLSLYLLVLFSCYFTSISMFTHTHIVQGASIAHSHLGGDKEHSHSDSQCRVIDLLSHFLSEYAEGIFTLSIFSASSECKVYYQLPVILNEAHLHCYLRAPPCPNL